MYAFPVGLAYVGLGNFGSSSFSLSSMNTLEKLNPFERLDVAVLITSNTCSLLKRKKMEREKKKVEKDDAIVWNELEEWRVTTYEGYFSTS